MSSVPDRPARLLHVGPDPSFVRAAIADSDAVDREITVAAAPDVETATDYLDEQVACVVLESEAAFDAVLDHPACPPAIVVAGEEATLESALSAGADDVVVRRADVDAGELLARRVDTLLAAEASDAAAGAKMTDALLDTIDDVFYMVGPDGQLQRWNRRLVEVTGYSDAEIADMDAVDFFPLEERGAVAETIDEILETGNAELEAHLETSDGERIPYHLKGTCLEGDDGSVEGFVGVGRDISERVALEDRLETKDSLLDHIFDHVPTALYIKDEQGRHLRMSDYDRSESNVAGRTDPEIYGETEFTEETYADDMRVIEDGEEIINKEEYNPNNGEWTLTSKVPWRDDDGEIRGLIGVSRFITEKKEYEEELHVRTRAMDEAPVGITVHEVAEEGAPVIYANDRFEALTGYDQSEFAAGVGDALFGPETDPEKVTEIRAAFESHDETTTVLLLYDADGSPFWGRVNVAPVYDDGDLTHTVGFLQDVTETKERAEEIERRLDEFGDLLAEELQTPLTEAEEALASASAEDDSLVAARQSVEQAEKLIDDLTAVHDFSVKSRSVFEADGGEPQNEQ